MTNKTELITTAPEREPMIPNAAEPLGCLWRYASETKVFPNKGPYLMRRKERRWWSKKKKKTSENHQHEIIVPNGPHHKLNRWCSCDWSERHVSLSLCKWVDLLLSLSIFAFMMRRAAAVPPPRLSCRTLRSTAIPPLPRSPARSFAAPPSSSSSSPPRPPIKDKGGNLKVIIFPFTSKIYPKANLHHSNVQKSLYLQRLLQVWFFSSSLWILMMRSILASSHIKPMFYIISRSNSTFRSDSSKEGSWRWSSFGFPWY